MYSCPWHLCPQSKFKCYLLFIPLQFLISSLWCPRTPYCRHPCSGHCPFCLTATPCSGPHSNLRSQLSLLLLPSLLIYSDSNTAPACTCKHTHTHTQHLPFQVDHLTSPCSLLPWSLAFQILPFKIQLKTPSLHRHFQALPDTPGLRIPRTFIGNVILSWSLLLHSYYTFLPN